MSFQVPMGTRSVAFPTWTDNNGQDDLKWYNGFLDGNIGWFDNIFTSSHNNEKGLYNTHMYAYDKYGKVISSAGVRINMN